MNHVLKYAGLFMCIGAIEWAENLGPNWSWWHLGMIALLSLGMSSYHSGQSGIEAKRRVEYRDEDD